MKSTLELNDIMIKIILKGMSRKERAFLKEYSKQDFVDMMRGKPKNKFTSESWERVYDRL